MTNTSNGTISNTPRDFFLYLLAMFTLYNCAFNFIALVFEYINGCFPDILQKNYYYANYVTQSMRWHMASLMINFPVYWFVTHTINRDRFADPQKNNLRIRKWLLYLTLFLGALIIMCDLAVLVFNFLGGEISIRFILKSLTILLTIGLIFYYYLQDIKQAWTKQQSTRWGLFAAILVGIVLIWGFFKIGTPRDARLYQFDHQKVADLNDLQGKIIVYWRAKNKLPASLSALSDGLSNVRLPVDPQTQQPYLYEPTQGLSFKLCTYFNKPSLSEESDKLSPAVYPNKIGYQTTWNWYHPAGNYCFTRSIDPDLYRKP